MAAQTDYWVVSLNHAWAVQSDDRGIEEEGFDCRQSAQDWIDERRAEEAEAEAAQLAEYLAQEREKDLIYRQVAALYIADEPATHPRNFAVREVLDAIDSLGRSSTDEVREAA